MIQNIKKYPDESVNVNSGPISNFASESFKDMVEDLIDTAKENNLEALSAILIGYPYQLFVLKENDEYKVYANARIIRQTGEFNSKEECIYFHNIPITIKRYSNLSLVYQNEKGEDIVEKIDNKEKAVLIQRMIDWTFNTSLIDRLKPQHREEVVKALSKKGEMPSFLDSTCPTNSKKDYFISVADKLLFFMFISLLLPLFGVSKGTLDRWYSYDKFAFGAVWVLLIGFFIYAQYEAKKYKQCTSCQIGNQIGFIIKRGFANLLLFTIAYFLLG